MYFAPKYILKQLTGNTAYILNGAWFELYNHQVVGRGVGMGKGGRGWNKDLGKEEERIRKERKRMKRRKKEENLGENKSYKNKHCFLKIIKNSQTLWPGTCFSASRGQSQCAWSHTFAWYSSSWAIYFNGYSTSCSENSVTHYCSLFVFLTLVLWVPRGSDHPSLTKRFPTPQSSWDLKLSF